MYAIIAIWQGSSSRISRKEPMPRKTAETDAKNVVAEALKTSEKALQKTGLQEAIDRVAQMLDWEGLDRLMPLGLAVLGEFAKATDRGLDSKRMIEVTALMDRWGMKDQEKFHASLKKAGIPVYSVGLRSPKLVRLQDIYDKFEEVKS